MKNTIQAIVWIILIGLILTSCKSSKESQEMSREEKFSSPVTQSEPKSINKQKLQEMSLKQTKEALLGNWKWHKTECCARTPNTTMAKDTESSRSISFSQDNRLTYFENGEVREEVTYELGNALNDDRITLQTDKLKTAILHLKADTLVLDYGYMDLAIDYYVKE